MIPGLPTYSVPLRLKRQRGPSFCALLLLACLGLTTSALGMRGPRLVKVLTPAPFCLSVALSLSRALSLSISI